MGKLIRYTLGLTIILIAVLSTVVSTGLSIMYFSQLTTNETLSIVVVLFIILLQGMVLFGSISKGTIYKTTPQHYYTLIWFTRICFLISVLSTISFFNQFDKSDRTQVIQDLLYAIPFLNLSNNEWLVSNLTNMTLIWLSCIVIDLMSMFFPSVGSDLISGISTRKKIEIQDKTYLMKIFELLTYKPKKYIDNKCKEYGIIEDQDRTNLIQDKFNSGQNKNVLKISGHENSGQIQNKFRTGYNKNEDMKAQDKEPNKKINNNVLGHENSGQGQTKTKKVSTPVITASPQNPENVLEQKTQDTRQTEDKINIKEFKTQDIKTQDKNSGQNKIQDKNSGHEDKIKNIDEYIILNYKSGDKIKVKELREKFNIKNDREWKDKIIHNLESAFVNKNKRLERKHIENKDKFKIVK